MYRGGTGRASEDIHGGQLKTTWSWSWRRSLDEVSDRNELDYNRKSSHTLLTSEPFLPLHLFIFDCLFVGFALFLLLLPELEFYYVSLVSLELTTETRIASNS